MPSKPALVVNNLSKSFKIYRRSRDRLAQLFISKPLHRDFKALDNISFSLQRGEFLGIVGENGSGKSTLLKLVAGILLPDAGSIERGGKITGLLELGTGFNVELSGRQNIYLNGVYLNMDKTLLAEREQQIIDFAELGEFIDEPLKNYSSGMTMRLGFAIGIHADPLCFIIDEALSVGDARFQQKCFARLREFKTGGGSVLFVSHDMNAVKLLCDRALVLDHGAARHLGSPDEAVNIYNELMAAKGRSGKTEAAGYGNGDVFFTSAQILGADGTPVAGITSGAPCSVRFAYSCRRPVPNLTFGIMIRDRFGQDIFGTNGALLHAVAHVDSDGSGQFDFPAMNLGRGMYTISLSAHTGLTHLENCFHWWDNAGAFEILDDSNYIFSGIARLEASLHLDEKCRARQQ